MKYITTLMLLLTTTGFVAPSFADCPPPDSITITENNGSYTVIPPANFTYTGAQGEITPGPISLFWVELISSNMNYTTTNMPVVQTECNYQVNNVEFFLVNKSSYTTNLDPAVWKADVSMLGAYFCEAFSNPCPFTGP